MGKADRVKINPGMLKYAIESANTAIEPLSKELRIDPEKVRAWIKGSTYPTMKQLITISKKLGRSYYYFLLDEPPKDTPIPVDFRPLGTRNLPLKRETIVAIREAKSLQDVAREIMVELGINPKPLFETTNLENDPKEKAKEIRKELGIRTNSKRKEWDTENKAFSEIRDSIERLNVIVVTMDFPFEDARGFSLSENYPNVIGVSQHEPQKKAMNFTLLHELGHLLLRKEGVCNPEETIKIDSDEKEIENWCNRFASAVLLPEYIIRNEFYSDALRTNTQALKGKIAYISEKFYISKQAIAYALFKIELINRDTYFLFAQFKEPKKKQSGGGRSPPKWQRSINSRGKRFSEIVYQGNESGYLPTSQALGYLSVQLKDFNKVKEAINAR